MTIEQRILVQVTDYYSSLTEVEVWSKPNGALLLSELMNPAMDRRSGIPQKSQPEIVMMVVWISRTKHAQLKTRKRGVA